ncbi:hypothetical protein B4144_2991 [Bacillus atrophaeus]|nr:hypothetical protein B4144_2991 [Bacillus atrophaeus]
MTFPSPWWKRFLFAHKHDDEEEAKHFFLIIVRAIFKIDFRLQ